MSRKTIKVNELQNLPLGEKKASKALAMDPDLIALVDELAALYEVSFSKAACFLMREGLYSLFEKVGDTNHDV